jgi:ribose 5-phosphate isomerase B
MKIALASDHTGYEQLSDLQEFLERLGHECQNFGPKSLQTDDDYPDFIFKAAEAVANGTCQKGIVLGGDGQGEAMAANRLKGVRCGVYYGPAVTGKAVDIGGRISNSPYEIVRLTRLHNDANMLSIGARFVALNEMKDVIKLWLQTDFSGQPRHSRRIDKLDSIGQQWA